ncbi:MAG TPA: archease [Gemmatimonadales bacterium]|nr:archease [Gemmatimonadales bacterium]
MRDDDSPVREPVARDVGHTAEVELLARGRTFGDLLAAAGRGLGELSLGGSIPTASGEWRLVQVQAGDRAALVVNWLNELIYLAEVDRWIATEFTVERATDTDFAVRARGVTVDVPPSRVKAATLHGLEIAERDGLLQAHVILDV